MQGVGPKLRNVDEHGIPEHFWEKVNKTETCWVFIGCCDKHGYGRYRNKNVNYKAHRFVWIRIRGPIKEKLQVLHKCDNPPCVNPDHLFLGTQRDNMLDCVAKGRHRYYSNVVGENNPRARMNAQDIHDIRYGELKSKSVTQVAELYGVGTSLISMIRSRTIWKSLP